MFGPGGRRVCAGGHHSTQPLNTLLPLKRESTCLHSDPTPPPPPPHTHTHSPANSVGEVIITKINIPHIQCTRYRIAGYFRGVPIFVIFVTQRKTRNFPPPKITTPPKETVTCAAQEARPSVTSERMALFRYQFVQLMPMTVIPSTLFTTATANGSVRIPFSRWHDSSSPISTSHMPCKRGSL